MTDEERLFAVTDAMDEWWRRHAITAAQCISRLRALLDDAPSVEWNGRTNGDDYAEPEPDVDLVVSDGSVPGMETGVPFEITIARGVDGLRCYESGFGTRAAAKARAVALYVALRGVT